jgi:predicted dehydrogenase
VNKEQKLLRVGILGCGPIAQAAHFDACTKAKNIELFAICDVAEDLLDRMVQVWQPAYAYTDYEEMLANSDVDAIIIATADAMHLPLARKAIMAGKHVFVEKPVGTSISEAESLKRLVASRKLILQVGNMKRFDPGIAFAKEFIEEEGGLTVGCTGWYCDSLYRYDMTNALQPIIINSRHKKQYGSSDYKALDRKKYYLLTHGSHLVNTMQFIAGAFEWIEAYYHCNAEIHSWAINAGTRNSEAIVQFQLIVAVRGDWQEGFHWYGENGTVHCKTYLPWYYKSSDVFCFSAKTKQTISVLGSDAHFFKLELEAFAKAIMEDSESPVSIEVGIQDLRALIGISMSSDQGGRRIFLNEVENHVV